MNIVSSTNRLSDLRENIGWLFRGLLDLIEMVMYFVMSPIEKLMIDPATGHDMKCYKGWQFKWRLTVSILYGLAAIGALCAVVLGTLWGLFWLWLEFYFGLVYPIRREIEFSSFAEVFNKPSVSFHQLLYVILGFSGLLFVVRRNAKMAVAALKTLAIVLLPAILGAMLLMALGSFPSSRAWADEYVKHIVPTQK